MNDPINFQKKKIEKQVSEFMKRNNLLHQVTMCEVYGPDWVDKCLERFQLGVVNEIIDDPWIFLHFIKELCFYFKKSLLKIEELKSYLDDYKTVDNPEKES